MPYCEWISIWYHQIYLTVNLHLMSPLLCDLLICMAYFRMHQEDSNTTEFASIRNQKSSYPHQGNQTPSVTAIHRSSGTSSWSVIAAMLAHLLKPKMTMWVKLKKMWLFGPGWMPSLLRGAERRVEEVAERFQPYWQHADSWLACVFSNSLDCWQHVCTIVQLAKRN